MRNASFYQQRMEKVLRNLEADVVQREDVSFPVTAEVRFILAGNYIFKVNYRNIRIRCETCSKLTIKTPERRRQIFRKTNMCVTGGKKCSFFGKFGGIVLVSLLLTLNIFHSLF